MDHEQHQALLEKHPADAVLEDHPRHHTRSSRKTPRLTALILLGSIIIGSCAGGAAGLFTFQYLRRHELSENRCDLPNDNYLGNIPFVTKTLESDQAFLDADPGVVDSNFTGPWKSVNPSGFVALDAPALLDQGIDLRLHGRKSEDWSSMFVGFGVSAMHQMHCVIEMKRALISWDKGEETESGRLGHLNHCVEILRQTVMCAGDTSLEPPRNKDVYPQDVTGWGGVHRCRDWDALITTIRSRAIVRDAGGWRKWDAAIDS